MNSCGKRLFVPVFILLCALLLAGCAERIEFSSGRLKADAESISVVLQPGESALLDKFTNLSTADLSGSTCYDEIMAWADAHPQVAVFYTVPLPDGTVADNQTESLELPAPDEAAAQDAAQLLRYLPALKSVSFDGGDAVLSTDTLAAFCAVRADIDYNCRVSLFGKTISTDTKTLRLTGIDSAQAEELCSVLPGLCGLETVELGDQKLSPELKFESIAAMQSLRPDVRFEYSFTLYGLDFTTADTDIDLNHIPVDDGGAAVAEAMACMPELKTLDMDSCGVSDEDMAAIRNAYPQVSVVWRVWFGDSYSVRTDVEKILASQPSKGGALTPANTQSLKYCTKVKYLDLGHNPLLTDISFVSYMPELEVLIVAMDNWSDASPLADCPKLEYLELQTSQLSDLTPLSNLKELKHLNICYLYELTDISPLYSLTGLERLWIGCLSPVPAEQVAKMQECAPDCVINTSTYDPTDGGWRFIGTDTTTGAPIRAPRYDLLVEQFGYDINDYSFFWRDPKY